MVDDNVSNGFDPVLMHDRDEVSQLSLCAILAVEVVVVPGQVALGTDSITGRRQPDCCEACLSNSRNLLLQRLQMCTDTDVGQDGYVGSSGRSCISHKCFLLERRLLAMLYGALSMAGKRERDKHAAATIIQNLCFKMAVQVGKWFGTICHVAAT